MTEYDVVWNEDKTEGVLFLKKAHVDMWDRGSLADVKHAAGGTRCNPCSSLADYFREAYGTEQKCTAQTVAVDTSAAVSRQTFVKRY